MTEKPLIWVGRSRAEVRVFPAEARRNIGRQLYRVQKGFLPHDWKAMASVGPGVYELRVRTEADYRVLYVAKFQEAIYILHAFEKRSRKTRRSDLALAKERLMTVQRVRGEKRRDRKA